MKLHERGLAMSKILIVEDEESIADIEKDYLELNGYEVEVCNDGTSGLAAALHEDIDMCILDIMLPGTDGFEICNNVIHDNNNIGIDMIGFEGTALQSASYRGNRYDTDYVRNGKCYGNTVSGISAKGNDAYLEDGVYSLCAAGIYVDGGQDIEIYDNKITNCDIGIEVATEHNPAENSLFQVSGIEVYNNEISECTGFAGLAFGGYDAERGFTVECRFHHNTLRNNPVQIVVQRSKNNEIDHNTIIGGTTVIEYNAELPEEEMDNDFHDNSIAQ